MKRTVKVDPFFSNQPPLSFIEDLKKPLHQEKPEYFGKKEKSQSEIDVSGLYIANKFADDPNELLETIYADFNNFLKVYEIGGNRFPIYLDKGDTECFEAYKLIIENDKIKIIANDTEGIRRGIIYLEDELRRREGAFLEEGVISKKPIIRSRITRCFFSPINRAPKFGDELSDDIDYYPDEYLNRLMHDGTNGVWVYTRFADLMPSSIIKENGVGHEKRIAKLNRTIEKCAKYGIGVYIFAMEPVWLNEEMKNKYPGLVGSSEIYDDISIGQNVYTACANSPLGKQYLHEAGTTLLELAPKLKGYICITYGERMTNCASHYKNCNCPICSKMSPGEVLATSAESLFAGFKEKNPDFETISWTYGHRIWDYDDIREYVRKSPDNMMLMQNFDDMGYEEQLGKVRQCVDYWLSYVGPSDLFKITAAEAKKHNKHMFAKIQACCSHEIASVPYIPVPGILYEKYAGAREYNVEGMMQCWYFGNYPSMMSKAAGELSFIDKFEDKKAFLKHLAGIYWGNTQAEKIASAWDEFEKGYKNYPMNIMFSYYGPMHDSVVWKLALKPKNFQLPRTWQTLDPVDGDRIGESMLSGHDIDEVYTLLGEMKKYWRQGIEILSNINSSSNDATEQISIAKTLDLLIASGKNIIEFYMLREKLGLKIGDATELMTRMQELVNEEIDNSTAMISLCENDNRLGYHSEGEGFKFFPEKLKDRISSLKELLETEFPEIRERIKNGLTPLEYYDGIEDYDEIKRYTMKKGDIANAQWESIDEEYDTKFKMSYDAENLYIELYDTVDSLFNVSPEFRLLWPNPDIEFGFGGTKNSTSVNLWNYCIFGDRVEKELNKYQVTSIPDKGTHLLIKINRSDIGLEENRPFKIKFNTKTKHMSSWCTEDNPVVTLGKPNVVPGDYGWIYFED